MNRDTGSDRRILPSSTSIMIATPTIGFVIEARRKIASVRIGVRDSMFAKPLRFEVRNAAAPRDQRDDAGNVTGLDMRAHDVRYALQALRRTGRLASGSALWNRACRGAGGRKREQSRGDGRRSDATDAPHGATSRKITLASPDPSGVVLGVCTRPIRCILEISIAVIFRVLRIRAQWSRQLSFRIRAEHLVRRASLLAPPFERGDRVERVRTVAAAAMPHSGHHEQSHPIVLSAPISARTLS